MRGGGAGPEVLPARRRLERPLSPSSELLPRLNISSSLPCPSPLQREAQEAKQLLATANIRYAELTDRLEGERRRAAALEVRCVGGCAKTYSLLQEGEGGGWIGCM